LYRIKAFDKNRKKIVADKKIEKREYGHIEGGSVDRGNIKIEGTVDQYLYQTERYQTKGYNFQVPNSEGGYTVNLHFAATWTGLPGSYKSDPDMPGMNILIEGKQVLNDFHYFKEAGMNKALIKKIENIDVSDGELNIEMYVQNSDGSKTTNGVIINAVEVIGEKKTIRVNCGANKEYKDKQGQIWLADQSYYIKKELIDSFDVINSEIKIEKSPDNVILKIINEQHKDLNVNVIATCRIKPDSALMYWNVEVKNKTDLWVKEIEFPVIVCNQIGENPEDDYVMQSYCDGNLILNPMKNLGIKDEFPWGENYPGGLSAQLMSFQDDEGGLYYGVHDGNGYTKGMHQYRTLDGINLVAVHLFPYEYGNDYKIPYDTVLAVFQGDWYYAADIYKEWAIKQEWCSKKIVERKDIPKWLIDGTPTIDVYGIVKHTFPDGEDSSLVKSSKILREMTGRPSFILMAGWEKNGPWITPEYFPPRAGEENFRKGTKELRERGDYTGVYISGLKWTLDKGEDGKPYKDKFGFDEKGKPYAIVREDGRIYISPSNPNFHTEICCGTNFAYEMLSDIIKECQDRDINVPHLDQIVGGGQAICYAKNHNHKPGPGNYQYQSFKKLFSGLLKQGLKRDPNFATSPEEPNELYNQSFNCYFGRDQGLTNWPRGNGKGIPLFTYLYNEYIPEYTPDVDSGSFAFNQGILLICGLPPVVGNMAGIKEIEPVVKKTIQGSIKIFDSPGCKYLTMGKMLHPLKIDIPVKDVEFIKWDHRGEKIVSKKYLKFPVILHSVFENPYGNGVGAVFINWTEDVQKIEFPLSLFSLPKGDYNVWKYGKDGSTDKPFLPKVSSEKNVSIEIELEYGESVFIEVSKL